MHPMLAAEQPEAIDLTPDTMGGTLPERPVGVTIISILLYLIAALWLLIAALAGIPAALGAGPVGLVLAGLFLIPGGIFFLIARGMWGGSKVAWWIVGFSTMSSMLNGVAGLVQLADMPAMPDIPEFAGAMEAVAGMGMAIMVVTILINGAIYAYLTCGGVLKFFSIQKKDQTKHIMVHAGIAFGFIALGMLLSAGASQAAGGLAGFDTNSFESEFTFD
ncbi:MAG: hypothetical protein AAGD00_06710 [Planctomycetota bacterium]